MPKKRKEQTLEQEAADYVMYVHPDSENERTQKHVAAIDANHRKFTEYLDSLEKKGELPEKLGEEDINKLMADYIIGAIDELHPGSDFKKAYDEYDFESHFHRLGRAAEHAKISIGTKVDELLSIRPQLKKDNLSTVLYGILKKHAQEGKIAKHLANKLYDEKIASKEHYIKNPGSLERWIEHQPGFKDYEWTKGRKLLTPQELKPVVNKVAREEDFEPAEMEQFDIRMKKEAVKRREDEFDENIRQGQEELQKKSAELEQMIENASQEERPQLINQQLQQLAQAKQQLNVIKQQGHIPGISDKKKSEIIAHQLNVIQEEERKLLDIAERYGLRRRTA